MWSRVSIVAFVVGIQLVLPCYLAYDVWRGKSETRWAWCLRAVAAGVFMALLFVTGRWDILSYYVRFALPVLFVLAAIAGYVRVRGLPWLVGGRPGAMTTILGSVLPLMLFAGLLVYAVRGFWYDDEPVRLALPLRGGAFYVGQGGNSPLINYHNTHATQRYALDILQVNGIGRRTTSLSLYPAALDSYVIFGQTVRSPCDGRIVGAVDGLVDNIPPQTDAGKPAGNHVIVACHGVHVFLAHLQRDSVTVRPGASVRSGDVVGRVGNSGNTSEPHLHIHAVRDGTAAAGTGAAGTGGAGAPVPIVFDGTFRVRNTILGID